MNRLKLILFWLTITICASAGTRGGFVTIDGVDLRKPTGEKLFIKGTNLGNWLNPEGYMFGFKKTNSYWMIDNMFCQLVGPDAAADFWRQFKDNYITRKDIEFIASTGSNTIRLPFNYKLFTDEDYMGLNSHQDGFARIDSVVNWCRDNNLYLILDMHDCPGGQTGDNIDNSFGYPWLFESETAQQLFCDIWRNIAERYKDEPVILGYEPMNEPIAHYFKDDLDRLNSLLEPLYKRVIKAIREVDNNHIVILGGAQWNGNFSMFTDWKFDNKIIYSCHRYGACSGVECYQDLINFRDKTGLPMFMGEIGHNTDDWQKEVCHTLINNNIGYTFWPYKKVDNSCFMAIKRPAEWDSVIVNFAETDRSTFEMIRNARPDKEKVMNAMKQFIRNLRTENCTPQNSYIQSLLLK